MKVVSIINYKGGVGKTTLTANLGAYAAMKGYRVLLMDLDPQTHLTFSFMTPGKWRADYKDNRTMKNYFDRLINGMDRIPLSSLVVPLELKQCRKLDILCSSLEMTDLDTELLGKRIGLEFPQMASNSLAVYNYLRKGLQDLKGEYDLVLIDCPPNCNVTVRTALTASDYYLIPARPDYLSSLGIDNLKKNILKFLGEYNNYREARLELGYEPVHLECLGVVPMMVLIRDGEPQLAQQIYLDKIEGEGNHLFQFVRNNNELFGKELKREEDDKKRKRG